MIRATLCRLISLRYARELVVQNKGLIFGEGRLESHHTSWMRRYVMGKISLVQILTFAQSKTVLGYSPQASG